MNQTSAISPCPEVAEARFYNWKAKYGGLEVSDAKRLKAMQSENAKPNTLLADAGSTTRREESTGKKWRNAIAHICIRSIARVGWMMAPCENG